MDAEQLTIGLRPRDNWEAIDLGTRLTMAHGRVIWTLWLIVAGPIVAALALAMPSMPWIAALVFWWLKPLFDRFVLHVLSQAVFGQVPGVLSTLKAWRSILWPGLAGALLWRRWDPARSFHQAVNQLERQIGRRATTRRRLLGRRTWGHAAGLTLVAFVFQFLVMGSLIAGLSMLVPGDLFSSVETDYSLPWWAQLGWVEVGSLIAGMSFIEPVYVGAGFALYLNRRVLLEGWDVEVALRRLEHRLVKSAVATAALVLAVVVAGGLAIRTQPVRADTPPAASAEATVAPAPSNDAAPQLPKSDARRNIDTILAEPEFGHFTEVERWRFVPGKDKSDRPTPTEAEGWRAIGDFIAVAGRVIGWILAIVAVGFIVRAIVRKVGGRGPREAGWRPPEALFGLAITPSSLPADVAGAARALLAAGDLRGALSLLYRASLSRLVHDHGVRLEAGATEGDALDAARAHLPSASAGVFAQLVRAWIAIAYAARTPRVDDVAALCDAWEGEFRPSAGAAPA